jgi:hypothetical protein
VSFSFSLLKNALPALNAVPAAVFLRERPRNRRFKNMTSLLSKAGK